LFGPSQRLDTTNAALLNLTAYASQNRTDMILTQSHVI